MRKIVIGRIISAALTACGWAFAGARFILDAIGYSTAPDDAAVAAGLLEKFILWLMGLPWWAPLGFALLTTCLLIYLSWRPVAVPTVSPVKVGDDQAHSTALNRGSLKISFTKLPNLPSSGDLVNIFSWYCQTVGVDVSYEDGTTKRHGGTVLSIFFQSDFWPGHVRIESIGKTLPYYEVKHKDQKGLVIYFSGFPEDCIVSINATSEAVIQF